MTDASEQLLAQRFGALASALDDSDWLDVRRRAALDGRRRAWIVLPLAAAVAAIAVGSALALYRDSIDFWSAPSAPERIVVDFHRMRVHASPGLGPNVVPGEARTITQFEIDGERRGLFVAPTTDGSYCWRLHYVGSCGRLGPDQPAIGSGGRRGEHGGLDWISGDVIDPEVARIELEYEDGSRVHVPFIWVSDPIDAGFFSFEVPPEHLTPGTRALALLAFDEDGAEIARRDLPLDDPREDAPDGLPHEADRTQRRTLFDLRDHNGNPWKLDIAPAPGERTCYAYEFGSGCFSPRFPRTNDALGLRGGGVVSLCCAVADGVARVVLRYQDGARTELIPRDGFLLYLLPPDQYTLGHRLEQITWLDAEGRRLSGRTFDPAQTGIYPCAKEDEIDRGYGVRTCP